jgi:hypothetical protein
MPNLMQNSQFSTHLKTLSPTNHSSDQRSSPCLNRGRCGSGGGRARSVGLWDSKMLDKRLPQGCLLLLVFLVTNASGVAFASVALAQGFILPFLFSLLRFLKVSENRRKSGATVVAVDQFRLQSIYLYSWNRFTSLSCQNGTLCGDQPKEYAH